MGVVFFPSLPFMGVMLFPSYWLGYASGEGGASLALLSLFFYLSSSSSFLPLLSSFLPLLFSILLSPPFSSFASTFYSLFFFIYFHLVFFSFILSFSFVFCFLLLLFFFFYGTACIVCFQDVGDDATGCNLIVIRL